MNDFDALLVKVKREAKKIGIPISDNIDSRIAVNTRAKTRYGRCTKKGNSFVIELSSILIDAPEISCRQTIAHELIHTCPGCMDHGDRFRYYASKMNNAYGYNISRTNSAEEMGVPDRRKTDAKFIITCRKCGSSFTRTKRSALIESPSKYRCKCGGELYVRTNTNEPVQSEAPAVSSANYILLCLKCGRKIQRQRMSAAIKNPSAYRCSCGGMLKRIY